MNTEECRKKLDILTEKIIGCCFTVASTLGNGFLEKVYENALCHELQKSGLSVVQQCPVKVVYDGVTVGDYIADIIVDELVIVELKAVKILDNVHRAQCLNYLKATNFSLCLLVNFGSPRIEIKRIVHGF